MILATHGIVGSQIQSFVGLLDTYPNAAAAYSVRKLRTAYTGSAINVRRSSDNTEQDIGFTALGNLDTTSLTSFCSGTNGFVTTWYDQSGNTRNATQSTAANQPQIVSSGTILNINSKPSLKFDGINDGLNVAFSGISQIYSLNKVEKWNVISGGQMSASFNAGGPYFQWNENANTFANYVPAAPGRDATAANTNQTLFSYYDANGFYQNNVLTSSRGTSPTSFTDVTIGSYASQSLPANVNIQEFIIYTTQQISNRTGISSDINTYYAIY
jgi:hypothetical protein